MAKQLFVNNWAATLQAELSASATSMSIESVQAAKLVGLGTGDHYLLTLASVDGDGRETGWEIVKVTAVAGGVLTVARGQEGTTAVLWPVSARVSARLTAGGVAALQSSSGGGSMTPEEIKTAYESNPDTNAFTDAQATKLGGIATGATKNANTDELTEGATNQYFTAARVRAVVLTGLSLATNAAISAADSVLGALGKLQAQITAHFGAGGSAHADATTGVSGFMSAADKTKLNGVAAGATANDTDANLKNRANHTGSQAISTVTGLQTALDAKMANPMTTAGDLIVGGSGGAPTRLGKGADGQVLGMVAGAEAWVTPSGGAVWDALASPSIVAGALALDLANPVGFVVSLTANITSLTFTNTPSAKVVTFSLEFVQDATGGRTVTWPGSVTTADGSSLPQPTATANTSTIFTLQTRDGGASFKLFSSRSGALVQSTVSASGTSVTFSGIPAGVRRVKFAVFGISTNGSSMPLLRLGAGSVLSTGYVSTAAAVTDSGTIAENSSTGFALSPSNAASSTYSGSIELENVGGNLWTYKAAFGDPGIAAGRFVDATGSVDLGGTLDRIVFTAANGTDNWDLGTIAISYEVL